MDTFTCDIRAFGATLGREDDRPVLPDLLDRIPKGKAIGTVTADGTCHTGDNQRSRSFISRAMAPSPA